MSFVLDALNKADRERDDSQSVEGDLKTNDFLNSDPRLGNVTDKRNVKYFLLLIFIVVLLSVWIYQLLMLRRSASSELTRSDDVKRIAVDLPVEINNPVNRVLEAPQREKTIAKPNYNITGHIYLRDNHSANKIFIDEISYRIGSRLSDGSEIISITPHMLVIQKDGEYFEIEF